MCHLLLVTCCNAEMLSAEVLLAWWNVEPLGKSKVLPAPNSLAENECLLSLDIVQRQLPPSPTLLGVDVSVGPLMEKRHLCH